MNTIVVPRSDVPKLLESTQGRIFSAVFMKKDKTPRRITCRLGVKSHLRGGKQSYDPRAYGLVTVFDMKKQDYRSINLNTLMALQIDGNVHLVAQKGA